MTTAKIFWSGRSQAVRLPKDFRVDGDEVRISRRGNAIILEPVVNGWSWLGDVQGPIDGDFVSATEENVPVQKRPALDLFK
ncbi:type II toxin-antitoxin system VapB family antitoxin [Rhizobium sp. TRM95111]|uniref:antitoxin n=1 Tax=Rhizobium alarense TaxID=2846851 RepID=UPI001F1C4E8B|nr:type II toxin-antitoxin system VapB family antitoxin [Rhizobium alarense]MCF3638787.1 type II toxin-antitoxin system VapB family antitoxin [Rhizobium alarense]